MENQIVYEQKNLKFTYEDYVKRGKTIQNLIIDKYVVYNMVGEGSNGQVYKGMDDKTKKIVAIKLMDIRQINSEKSVAVRAIKQRLCESEPRLMFQCNSPNLIKCYDVYRNDDLKVLILEYCNGSTLQKEIDDKRRIPEKEAIEIIKHLINGLMELHRKGIVHRDLKAENIMSHNGTYKIIDFGFSKKLQISQENAEVKGTSLGTITTMAPEVMSKKPYGLKADIWSLGVIYFQMIYGVYPYDSLTATALYQEIKSKKLFEKPNPPVINGFTPSKQSYDFIKFVIVFETSERPSWKELSEYPLIKNQNDQVNQRFIQKVEVVADPRLQQWDKYKNSVASNTITELDERDRSQKIEQRPEPNRFEEQRPKQEPKRFEEQKPRFEEPPKKSFVQQIDYKSIEKPKFRIDLKKEQPKQAQSRQRFRDEQYEKLKREQQEKKARIQRQKKQSIEEKPIINISKGERKSDYSFKVREMKNDQVLTKKKQENKQEIQEYEFTQRSHLQCLKTQLIFREIINPLYTTKYLVENQRSTVEFMYLLLARCFNNMSPIQYELENRLKNKDMIKNLNDQITPLYNQVRAKFLEFSDKLTKAENKWGSILGDFFQKNVNKSKFNEKDNYLTGIEIINYSKAQQIQFTFNYYKDNIQKKIDGVSNLSNVVRRLNKYTQINNITRELLDAQRRDFLIVVKEIIA